MDISSALRKIMGNIETVRNLDRREEAETGFSLEEDYVFAYMASGSPDKETLVQTITSALDDSGTAPAGPTALLWNFVRDASAFVEPGWFRSNAASMAVVHQNSDLRERLSVKFAARISEITRLYGNN